MNYYENTKMHQLCVYKREQEIILTQAQASNGSQKISLLYKSQLVVYITKTPQRRK